jgi:hypothetical protein
MIALLSVERIVPRAAPIFIPRMDRRAATSKARRRLDS